MILGLVDTTMAVFLFAAAAQTAPVAKTAPVVKPAFTQTMLTVEPSYYQNHGTVHPALTDQTSPTTTDPAKSSPTTALLNAE